MAVHFFDDQTGEISDVIIDTEDAPVSPRRAARPSAVLAKRERKRAPFWPVGMLLVAAVAFLIGGGVGMSFAQEEIQQLKIQLDYPAVP